MNAPLTPIAEAIYAAFPAPGFYPDMPAEDYHRVEAMSAGGARTMRRSMAHYKLQRSKPKTPTDAMRFGSAVHLGVLEPARFAAEVIKAPKFDRRTALGKADALAFEHEHEQHLVLAPEDYERALGTVAAVLAHPAAARLLRGAEIEGSTFWLDARYKVPCKSRWDIRNAELGGALADLKTCEDASPRAFARDIASWEYHAQAAHYMSGEEHIANCTPAFFAFIAAEKEPPHGVAVYTIDGAAVLAGGHLMNIALHRYAEALTTGHYPCYTDSIESIRLPKWALSFDL